MPIRTRLSHASLKQLLNYDGRTGKFTWRTTRNHMIKGKEAGSLRRDGSVVVTIAGHGYSANRLAWFYATGKWPEGQLTYRDNNPGNLRLQNLAPRSEYFAMTPTAIYQRDYRERYKQMFGAPRSRTAP